MPKWEDFRLRSPACPVVFMRAYYACSTKVNKKYWNVHNVSFDISEFHSIHCLVIALLSLCGGAEELCWYWLYGIS